MNKLLPFDSPVYLRRLAKAVNNHHTVYISQNDICYRVMRATVDKETSELKLALFHGKQLRGKHFKFFDANGQEIVAERLV
jgi:hypothetical protein